MINVLLVGLGKFGYQYYQELHKLEKEGLINLVAVVTKKSVPPIQSINHCHILISQLENILLDQIDLAVVVSPAETHLDIIERLVPHTKILVEKPLVPTNEAAQRLFNLYKDTNRIFPAQIFRYHPLTEWFADYCTCLDEKLISIKGTFINNHLANSSPPLEPILEMNHMADLSMHFFGATGFGKVDSSRRNMTQTITGFEYGDHNIKHTYTSGWNLDLHENVRKYVTRFETHTVTLDYVTNIASIEWSDGRLIKHFIDQPGSIIRAMLLGVLRSLESGARLKLPSFQEAIALIMNLTFPIVISGNPIKKRKSAAIIGGGVFGTSCAIELSKDFEVTLYEKKEALLNEASYRNQWRHHSGFHYPLSHVTIAEIQNTKHEFEELFGQVVHKNIPAYYFVSARAKEIPPQRYLSTCNLYKLNYQICPPPLGVAGDSVSLSMLTDEGIYDVDLLRTLMEYKLSENHRVTVQYEKTVIAVDIVAGNKKRLTILDKNSKQSQEDFDVVVDCSNAVARGFCEELKPTESNVRFEIVELLQMEIDIPQCCLTVIDGPFVSLTSMGVPGKFMLSHRDHSVLCRFVSEGGPSATDVKDYQSNRKNLINAGMHYFPCLQNARNIESFISVKAISPYQNEVWERPTVIRDHGFGVISVIGGKILTAISNSKEVRGMLVQYSDLN